MQTRIWKHDAFLALAFSGLFAALYYVGLFSGLDKVSYEWLMRLSSRNERGQVAVIAIDDDSLNRLGDWPWPRDKLALLLEKLSWAEPTAVGLALDLHRPQLLPAQAQITELVDFYDSSKLVNAFYCRNQQADLLQAELSGLGSRLHALQTNLDTDKQLAKSLKIVGKVVLSAFPNLLPQTAGAENALLEKQLFPHFDTRGVWYKPQPLPSAAVNVPLEIFSESAASIAALPNNPQDKSGQAFPLVLQTPQGILPTLPLRLAAQAWQLDKKEISPRPWGIKIGNTFIPTDHFFQVQPVFYHASANNSPIEIDSFARVLSGEIGLEKYRHKVVLIGFTSPSYALPISTPIGEMPPLLAWANLTASLLKGDLIHSTWWSKSLEILLILGIIAYLWQGLPRLSMKNGILLTALIAISLIALTQGLWQQGIWLPISLPLLLAVAGQLVFIGKQQLPKYRQTFHIDNQAVENNRLQALALQGQGRLDLAFEKFQLCPADDLILSLLYNLGLDFERKRQFKQSIAVYRYLDAHCEGFRDIELRMARLSRSPAKTAPRLQPGFDGNLNAWFGEDGELSKPMLGRYQVEKKLGKGAMGVVYLGKDPKLDRIVALKTLALSQEFEGEELQQATTRFFNEAAAAGRLSHPNIISVYDAGEEHDLAYISMEFFKGGDLSTYARRENLLTLPVLLDIFAKTAESLDYAHRQKVIHRDIKPANILYNPATGQIKLTDFGIARITDMKKTRTGAILGTPSYMSPEQLTGKQVDGRSDLFSLGITFYQLLTGELPFKADSLAELMFKITHEPHTNILEIRADLPLCIKTVIDTLLHKESAKRYPDGKALLEAIRDCQNLLEGAVSPHQMLVSMETGK